MNKQITEENVIVAVRVRPFNEREVKRNAECVVEMVDEKETIVRNSNNKKEVKKFSFDYSYWSFDDFYTDKNGLNIGKSKKYAEQDRIFNDLGKIILNNAWNGFNVSLFAYGQTGSGKSYSIVGFPPNKGLVPMVCEELFNMILKKKTKGHEYQVCMSIFEIYCEKIRDLLIEGVSGKEKKNLKIREHPKTGFYVENLSTVEVKSFNDIEKQIDIGTKNRTIAATNMNMTSSRAHTIIKIYFKQKIPKKSGSGTTTKTSEINLVDLAGSEKQKDAEVEGERLKEGIVINKSLTTLGRVIKSIVDLQQLKGKKKVNIQIPYRDSVLTCVLKNALGGNSKTIMIAAISPADINYDETLSTLRFADRVKNIKTKAIVNESVTDRMIRELVDENTRLKELIDKGVSIDGKVATDDEVEELKRLLENNKIEMENLKKNWEERLSFVVKSNNYNDDTNKKRKEVPHLWNLNEDPALTNKIVHFINKNDTLITNQIDNDTTVNKIVLQGLSIMNNHAMIFNKNNKKIFLKPIEGKRILINGHVLHDENELKQNDVILFGGNHMYVFNNPKKEGIINVSEMSYDKAQLDIVKNGGFGSQLEGVTNKTDEQIQLEEDLITLMPAVERANLMSKELKKNIKYEIIISTPESRGLSKGNDKALVKAKFEKEDIFFVWNKDIFMTRYYDIQEIYQDFVECGKERQEITDWDYPFFESSKNEILIGTCFISLKSLSKLIDISNDIPVLDYTGEQVCTLTVSLTPCQLSGKEIVGEFIENSSEIVGKNLGFKIKIFTANGLLKRFEKSWCSYKFFEEEKEKTLVGRGSDIIFAHEKIYYFKPVTKKLLDYIENSFLIINMHGFQKTRYKVEENNDIMNRIEESFKDKIEKKPEEVKIVKQTQIEKKLQTKKGTNSLMKKKPTSTKSSLKDKPKVVKSKPKGKLSIKKQKPKIVKS
uniref:Kinesin-like protein n=1 Tax=Parastrongyloides trichosuri TaxID=131310 RepID=A0A0N4Z581_PARTI